jgi:hypothetical protein
MTKRGPSLRTSPQREPTCAANRQSGSKVGSSQLSRALTRTLRRRHARKFSQRRTRPATMKKIVSASNKTDGMIA